MRSKILELLQQGYTKREIANTLGIVYSTVKKHSTGILTAKKPKEHRCRSCNETNPDAFYTSKGNGYYCKKCHNQKTYKDCKLKIVEYMKSRGGAKCQKCGYDNCIAALEFHHRDPTQKDPKWIRGWSLPKLKVELDKCDILCANCHRETHWLKK